MFKFESMRDATWVTPRALTSFDDLDARQVPRPLISSTPLDTLHLNMRNLTRNAKSTNQNYLDAHEDPSDEEVEMQQDDNIDASSSSSVTKKTRKGKGKAVEQDSSDMEEQVQGELLVYSQRPSFSDELSRHYAVKTVDKGKGKAVAQDAGDNDDDDDGSADEKEDSEKAAAEQEKLKAEIAAREKDNIEEHRRGELEVFLAMPIDILAEVRLQDF